jgi:hypothetical protein
MKAKSGISTSNSGESGKRGYSSPKLIVYGSVRDLTGSTSGTVGDGAGMNMLPSDRAYKDHVVRVGTRTPLVSDSTSSSTGRNFATPSATAASSG